ncbi:hypothetical protein [Tepidimonas sp.]|uniref:hypothetical protein n=1 Tax=Tepidimonas sp. TaxID=2002775 RepID=UPI00391B78F6
MSEPSPDFKGIKTSPPGAEVYRCMGSEPSPDFKGIKTFQFRHLFEQYQRPNQALISKGLRLASAEVDTGFSTVRTKP